jgi:DNA-binding MarR family transcriptional regulator
MLAFRRWLKGSLSLIQLHVLTVLEADGPLPMSRLAETLDVSLASATGIINRMEERGLVERNHDAADRRVVLVRPTAAGIAIFHDLAKQRREQLATLLARLSSHEMNSLLIGLRAMRNARTALHVEKANDGLVSVTVRKPANLDAEGVADRAATSAITSDK